MLFPSSPHLNTKTVWLVQGLHTYLSLLWSKVQYRVSACESNKAMWSPSQTDDKLKSKDMF